jgi:hypothetical protein
MSSSSLSTGRKRRSETAVVSNNDLSSSNAVPSSSISGVTAAGANRSTSKGSKLKVRIKRYHGVSQWVWGKCKKFFECHKRRNSYSHKLEFFFFWILGNHDANEVCGICQSAYEGVAPGGRWPGEDCPVVWGKCSHSFHLVWYDNRVVWMVCDSFFFWSNNISLTFRVPFLLSAIVAL